MARALYPSRPLFSSIATSHRIGLIANPSPLKTRLSTHPMIGDRRAQLIPSADTGAHMVIPLEAQERESASPEHHRSRSNKPSHCRQLQLHFILCSNTETSEAPPVEPAPSIPARPQHGDPLRLIILGVTFYPSSPRQASSEEAEEVEEDANEEEEVRLRIRIPLLRRGQQDHQ